MHYVLILSIFLFSIINNIAAQVTNQAPSPTASVVQTAAGSAAPTQSAAVSPILTAIVPNTAAAPSASNGMDASLASLPLSGTFGNTIYPGSATFIKPTGTKSVSPLFRINSKENVTFEWSFTNLKVQPQTLNLAAVAPNSVTYTISALPGAATSAVWHLSDVPPASPLMMGLYTIQLYDQRGVSAFPQPGWLAPVSSLKIALYSAESYSVAASGSDYCPYCFYSAGKKMTESLGPIALAVGVATVTSAFMLYELFH